MLQWMGGSRKKVTTVSISLSLSLIFRVNLNYSGFKTSFAVLGIELKFCMKSLIDLNMKC